MQYFRQKYLTGRENDNLSIYDLGSMDICGSYRDIFDGVRWRYVGLDVAPGKNVDLVLTDPYDWREIPSEKADVMISGQAFEHIEFFWLTFREMCRVLKKGGLCCIIAPSSGPEHRYPIDCWRFYPDVFRALARYGGLTTIESCTDWDPKGYPDSSGMWKDTFFVGQKAGGGADQERRSALLRRVLRLCGLRT